MTDNQQILPHLQRPEGGVLVLDKPQGPSSHQVAAWAQNILGVPVGHGGTLDPMVSGVLPLMTGRAAKLAPYLLSHDKEYVTVLRLHGDVETEDVKRIADEFIGRNYQRPPRKSAVKRALRIRTIYDIELLDHQDRLVLLRVSCEAGTYIRSLCHHMGLALGVDGHMEELRRTRSGTFSEKDAHTLHDLKDAIVSAHEGNTAALENMVLPSLDLVTELPKVHIRTTATDALCHGASLAGVGVLTQDEFKKGKDVAVINEDGVFVCTGTALKDSDKILPGQVGLIVKPKRVLLSPGIYAKGWTSGRKD